MKTISPENWPQFFTATIQEWKFLFSEDTHKYIIIQSLQFLVRNGRVKVFAFVIMSNHIHLIWQATGTCKLSDVQTSFLKFTSQQFLKQLKNDDLLMKYESNKVDRKHHFWRRHSLGKELITQKVFLQKLNYIHQNPIKAGICKCPEDYLFSSALYYEKGIDLFGFLEHYNGT